jgi:hypothetical protein
VTAGFTASRTGNLRQKSGKLPFHPEAAVGISTLHLRFRRRIVRRTTTSTSAMLVFAE